MKYPNAERGITKIFISEIMNIALSAFAIISLILLVILSDTWDDARVLTGSQLTLIVISVLGIVALVIYLIGLIQARKDEHEFQLALIMTVIALALSIAAELLSSVTPVLGEWGEFVCEIVELVAFESVVTGVVKLAKELGDEKIISLGRKMRILVTMIWIAVIVAKILEFISGDASENVKFVHAILETIDHIFYMILLFKGRKMLKQAILPTEGSIIGDSDQKVTV